MVGLRTGCAVRPQTVEGAVRSSLRLELLFVLLIALLLPAACTSSSDLREVEAFRATHVECNPRHFKRACQIGPDGRLYEYKPGEYDRP